MNFYNLRIKYTALYYRCNKLHTHTHTVHILTTPFILSYYMYSSRMPQGYPREGKSDGGRTLRGGINHRLVASPEAIKGHKYSAENQACVIVQVDKRMNGFPGGCQLGGHVGDEKQHHQSRSY